MRYCSIVAFLLSQTVGAFLPLTNVGAADLTLPKAAVFFTSFEYEETPAYSTNLSLDQMGWLKTKSFSRDAIKVIAGGMDGNPSAPDGHQMLKLESIRNPLVENPEKESGGPIISLKFSEKPLKDKLYFSGTTAFDGSIEGDTEIISRFYLNNATKEQEWLGIAFGIWNKKGERRFFYTKAPKGNAADLGDAIARPGVFYRFELDVDIPNQSYHIRVYDFNDHSLLASADDGMFRTRIPVGLNYLRLQNMSDDQSAHGDIFSTYYDQIWIGTQPIAKP